MSSDSGTLDAIVGKAQKGAEVLQDELRVVVDSFAVSQHQPKAYLALSLLWQNARKGQGSPVEEIARNVQKITLDYLSETNESALIRGISFLTALYRVDADSASGLFAAEGSLDNVMDSVDLDPSPELSLAVAKLLAEASGHKKSRDILTPAVRKWLDIQSKQTRYPEISASSAVALVKLWHAAATEKPAEEKIMEVVPDIDAGALTAQLKAMVAPESEAAALAEAVEGLAYLSTKPSIKEDLSKDAPFLRRLLERVPTRKASWDSAASPVNSALLYGIVSIVHNLARYRPMLSEEQKQIAKLKKLAKTQQGSSGASDEDEKYDDNAYVKARIHRLIDANVLPILSIIAILSDSHAIQLDVGRTLLNIVEEKEVRGKVLQSGGAKALRSIIKRLGPKVDDVKEWTTAPVALEPIQALAKLTITSPPIHVYGADVGALYDAIRPMSLLILHQSANQLQQFEGMMALTNLASHSPDMANRIAMVDGLLNKVELLWLEEHTLICRASMELICNLVSGSEPAFERYAGDGSAARVPTSKIHVILALCDVDDVPTRLAASGSLAVLSSSPAVCSTLIKLQLEKGRMLSIMTSLFSPIQLGEEQTAQPKEDANLIHRAAACVQNVITQVPPDELEKLKAQEDFPALQNTMVGLIKRAKVLDLGPALPPLAEAVRTMITSGTR